MGDFSRHIVISKKITSYAIKTVPPPYIYAIATWNNTYFIRCSACFLMRNLVVWIISSTFFLKFVQLYLREFFQGFRQKTLQGSLRSLLKDFSKRFNTPFSARNFFTNFYKNALTIFQFYLGINHTFLSKLPLFFFQEFRRYLE